MLSASPHRQGTRFVDAQVGWPAERAGPRVVVEHDDAAWRWAATGRLEAAGYQVASCPGPRHLPGERCPLVAGEACSLIDGADVVVDGLGVTVPEHRAVLTALRARHEELPVIVEIRPSQILELESELPGCRVVTYPVRPRELLAAVADATSSDRP